MTPLKSQPRSSIGVWLEEMTRLLTMQQTPHVLLSAVQSAQGQLETLLSFNRAHNTNSKSITIHLPSMMSCIESRTPLEDSMTQALGVSTETAAQVNPMSHRLKTVNRKWLL